MLGLAQEVLHGVEDAVSIRGVLREEGFQAAPLAERLILQCRVFFVVVGRDRVGRQNKEGFPGGKLGATAAGGALATGASGWRRWLRVLAFLIVYDIGGVDVVGREVGRHGYARVKRTWQAPKPVNTAESP